MGGSGRIGRFKGAGSLLVQAGGKLSTTVDLTSAEFEGNPAAGLTRLTMIIEDVNGAQQRLCGIQHTSGTQLSPDAQKRP